MKETEATHQDLLLDLLEERLNVVGPISSTEAFAICRDKMHHSTFSREFRLIMLTMMEQKKAHKLHNGFWIINKPNSRFLIKK